jgi:hypothetical protein
MGNAPHSGLIPCSRATSEPEAEITVELEPLIRQTQKTDLSPSM